MKPFFFLSILFVLFAASAPAQSPEETLWQIYSAARQPGAPEAQVTYDLKTGASVGTGGIVVSNRNTVLTADKVVANPQTGEVLAEGNITILGKNHIWEGTNIVYNFKTGNIEVGNYKAAAVPFFIDGTALHGSQSNGVYMASESFFTTDDYEQPLYKIRARILIIVPGHFIEAYGATLFLGDVPVFYVPHYKRTLGRHPNNYSVIPGYKSSFGAYILNSYNWYTDEHLDGSIHGDWRSKRGFAGGPDIDYHFGQYGDGSFRYYYARDQNPNEDVVIPHTLSKDRTRVSFNYFAEPFTNFTAKARVFYQSDPQVYRDFFEGEYRTNVQPATLAEMTKLFPNYTLDLLVQPRIVDFYETVERLPDLKLTAARQQVGVTPIFYEGENSFGYFHRSFSSANNSFANYSAGRGDTFHQFVLPQTYFGFLNVVPRVGGRLTYYTDQEGGRTNPPTEQVRGVFNTGAEFSTKASQVWKEPESDFWDVNGLRHIVEPSMNYVFVPDPSRSPRELPQFDTQLPSLRLQPIDFPDYQTIDSIDSKNVLRLTLRNKLQTKRDPGIENVVNWALYTDLRLNREKVPLFTDPNQTATVTQPRFSDFFSDLDFQPRTWLLLNSQIRYDASNTRIRSALHRITYRPNNTWSASFSHNYLMNDDPEFIPSPGIHVDGYNLFTTSLYYRFNENWGAHVGHRFEARDGVMEEQSYTIYRDLRSWTAALTLRLQNNRTDPATGTHRANDVTVAVTMSLKSYPRFGMGSDSERPANLLGY